MEEAVLTVWDKVSNQRHADLYQKSDAKEIIYTPHETYCFLRHPPPPPPALAEFLD